MAINQKPGLKQSSLPLLLFCLVSLTQLLVAASAQVTDSKSTQPNVLLALQGADYSTLAIPASSSANNDAVNAPQIADNTQPITAGSPHPANNNLPVASQPAISSPTTSSSATPFAPEGDLRRAFPSPYDSVFPGTEFLGPTIGVPDTDPVYPLEAAIYQACPALQKARIKIYGWANPGMDYSTSHHSNIPLTYAIVPNRLELDQLILRFERTPDTVQTEHKDWGFRVTNLFGLDYRWTTALGWYPASRELLNHNYQYGYDPVELYGQLYFPKIAKGMLLKFGRYISPPDIEAQLAPDNYLWTHSIMFTVDAYTHTGIESTIKLNNQWTIQGGIHAGDDMAPWAPGAIPTAEAYIRWVSKNNKDSFYGGVDSINNGRFRLAKEVERAAAVAAFTGMPATKIPAHDNLQQFNLTWSHAFNSRIHTTTEAYYLYTFDALEGGTVNNGPPKPFAALTGPGAFLPGYSQAWGVVNYTQFKISNKDFISVRPVDYLGDVRGWRTGFPTTYASWTIGWTHRFSDLLSFRPEIRYERALNGHQNPYDNGNRRYQFTFGADLIQRF